MKVLVITGPTATGKTELAVSLARDRHLPILSADSRQVYRGLDIGTGKDLDAYRDPPVEVHLIDVCGPERIYSLFDYQRDYRDVLRAHDRSRPSTPAILCGGTGLYIEAMIRDYALEDVGEDPELRRELAAFDTGTLVARLASLDPGRLERTDQTSRKRLIRALEIASAPSPSAAPPPFELEVDYKVLTTRADPDRVRELIDRRLEARLELGLIEEVAGLRERGLSDSRLGMLGLEYRHVRDHLIGESSREEMIRRLRTGIHQLAKRQRTWIRGMSRRGLRVLEIDLGDHDAVKAALDDPTGWLRGGPSGCLSGGGDDAS